MTATLFSSSSESKGKGKDKLDIIELVDLLPDFTIFPSIFNYTDANFELTD